MLYSVHYTLYTIAYTERYILHTIHYIVGLSQRTKERDARSDRKSFTLAGAFFAGSLTI